ncbi:MAG: hypothetical protein ACR2NN_25790 [Bryobacteraceae bacterium]
MLASLLPCAAILIADDAPAGLIRRVAARETETQAAQSHFTYEQSVTIEELDKHGARAGEYREARDIIFSPAEERTERLAGKPSNTLTHLQLTDEDFRDIREVQPVLLTTDRSMLYETKFRGEETMDDVPCWVIQIRPRQILQGQRLFDGLIWVDKSDYSIIRSEGEAVPQIRTTKTENLFPHFTTMRRKVDGNYRFPVTTYGDDTLYFRSGPQRLRLMIRYSKYLRFGADTKVIFEK